MVGKKKKKKANTSDEVDFICGYWIIKFINNIRKTLENKAERYTEQFAEFLTKSTVTIHKHCVEDFYKVDENGLERAREKKKKKKS